MRAPTRIVTLTPSLTEVVAELARDRIVAVDDYSSVPPEVANLPKVGSFMDPNFEGILSVEPDLVVLSDVQKKIAPSLESAGIRTIVLEMHTIDHVRKALTAVGVAVGKPKRARAIISEIDAEIDAAAKRAEKRPGPRPNVMVILDRDEGLTKLYAAGPGTFVDELLAIIGAGNAMAASGLAYSTISAEKILRSKPTHILDIAMGRKAADARKDWARLPDSVPAVASGRIHSIAEDVFTNPGPRVAEALARLEALIYGISER